MRATVLLASMLLALAAVAAPHAAAPADFPRLARLLNPAPGSATLIVHYHRPDGKYDGWNLWCWPAGKDGASFPFDRGDAFGRCAVVTFPKAPEGAGFIVRQGDWKAKDFDGDRGVSFAQGPMQEVWIVSGDPAVHTDPSAIDLSPRVKGAFLDARDRITLATTRPPTAEQLRKLTLKLAAPGATPPKVRETRGLDDAGMLIEVRLASPVADADVASMRVAMPDFPEAIVYARGVLDDPRFSPMKTPLGAACTRASTVFTTWSPVCRRVDLLLYGDDAKAPPREVPMKRGERGLWSATVPGDLHGTRYRYRFQSYGKDREVPDIHAVAATNDSAFSVVADLSREEPAGWSETVAPTIARQTDEVLYEVHVRDYSIADASCPAELRGTYLGLVQPHPAADGAPSSGIDHLKDLGVTAVHLLPVHDFTAKPEEYTWGYWTALFNVPESNYASRKGDPLAPVRELRQAIAALHKAGIRVVLDVVYNHTSSNGEWSPFDQTVPFYFFRTAPDGSLLNDSGCGNAVADERPMVRKYIVDSLEHWLRDYRVDGFRFDLLGTHTPQTVREACDRLVALRPDVTLYGEPWTGGGPIRFGKGAQKGLRMAVFNDHLRNAIRGDLDGTATGFATGPGGDREAVKRGVQGAIDDFAQEPGESVNYASAHDNLTLADKVAKAQPGANDGLRRAMQKLALGMVLTSQGVPFLHGASDFACTKGGNHNSYDAGDAVNGFDWNRKAQFADMHAWVRGVIAMRRAHPAFRMADDTEVRRAVRSLDGTGPLAFTIDGTVAGDPWSMILVAYNGEPQPQPLSLPGGDWDVVVDAERAGSATIATVRNQVTLAPYSMLVAHRK